MSTRSAIPWLAVVGVTVAVLGCGCGGDDDDDDALVARLAALPGVTVLELTPTQAPRTYRYFSLGIEQAADHDRPGGQHFTQHLTLIVNDPDAPMVLLNTGYWNYVRDAPFELTELLHANQLVMEHRFFGDSRPSPADWSELTIAQAAADQHHVVETFAPVFPGAWVTAGRSKGGMTSIFHRRFYPDDVRGTVAYVAPISFGAPDPRYDAWVNDTLGTPACRDAVKALAAELLANRRAMLEARAASAASASRGMIAYRRVALGPAVESAVHSLYWSFWQYYGIEYCGALPATTASDDELWQLLNGTPAGTGVWGDGVAPIEGNDDLNLARFEAYDYQATWQLGYPGARDTHLDGLLQYGGADYDGSWPTGVARPSYDGGEAMTDIAAWVHGGAASHVIWTYGGWDPWTAGQFDITGATDASKMIVPEAHHHGALLTRLEGAERATAFAMLEAWTGVVPDPAAVASSARSPRLGVELRPPSAVIRARQLRARGG